MNKFIEKYGPVIVFIISITVLITFGISVWLHSGDQQYTEPKEFSYGTVTLIDTANEYTVYKYNGYYLVDEKEDEYIIVAANDISHYKKSDNLVCVQETIEYHDKKG